MAEITVLWTAPDDVEGFEQHYRQVHLPLTLQWPGVTTVSANRVAQAVGAPEAPYHLIFRAQFPDQATLQAALASEATGPIVEDANTLGEKFNCSSTVLVADEIPVVV
jgi:uncharacterized protein (TIGR02118 family)